MIISKEQKYVKNKKHKIWDKFDDGSYKLEVLGFVAVTKY